MRFGTIDLDLEDTVLDYEPLSEQYFALIRAFLQDSYDRCTFYRSNWDKIGLSPGDLSDFSDLWRVPALGPQEVLSLNEMTLLPDATAAALRAGSLKELPRNERIAKKFTSSGSTAAPKVSFYTVDDWIAAQGVPMRRGLSHVDESAYLRSYNGFHPGHFAGKMFEDCLNLAGYHVENRHFAAADEGQIEGIQASFGGLGPLSLTLPPRVLSGSPSKGNSLDSILTEDFENVIGSTIRLILTSGMARDLDGDSLCDKVWEANALAGVARTAMVDMWGTAEVAGGAGAECQMNQGLHLLQGLTYTEVIDGKTGRHVENGQTGLLVCTGLKQGSRYIRYLVGDEALYVSDPCECGRASPRIKNINRVHDRQRLLDGCAAGW